MNLHFLYRNAKGETKHYEVANWVEAGYYVSGFCLAARALRTFRKDRVIEYLRGGYALLAEPYMPAPPKIARARTSGFDRNLPQITFTGFAQEHRSDLERRAGVAGLRVVQSVTQSLTFLCTGPNAGPKKVAKARDQRVYILTEWQLSALLETGELPDDYWD
ncbi:BRCT domain-containing protein [Cupriavidus agavae]|uniref:BRCT domain-containing protein n=1 Tax=Cupriavidus agavae TaxID=1001822 RepID=A0A4Q7S7A3_9BURK|nr:BRCT domain-containing protein [Cupriavidus agavae]RZT42276.1 hypothetical protein EV147_1302 [Cupriavidus agavae]